MLAIIEISSGLKDQQQHLGHPRELGAPPAHDALKVRIRELLHKARAARLRRRQLLLQRGLELHGTPAGMSARQNTACRSCFSKPLKDLMG